MYDVITIGTATRDTFLKSKAFKVIKDSEHLKKLDFPTGEAQCFALGSKIEVDDWIVTGGGGAANAAVTCARQGLRTACIAVVGADESGEIIFNELKKEGIAPWLIEDNKKNTASSVILLNEGGERTILNYRGASEDLKKNDIPFGKLKTKWLYVVPGRIPLPVITTIVAHAKKEGARIAINLSKFYIEKGVSALASLLKQCDVVIVNREEAAALTGRDFEDQKAIFTAFDELVQGLAVVTDGGNGVKVSDGKTIWASPVFPEKKLIDRTGAGDAFGSGFISVLAHAKKAIQENVIARAIRIGSANATSVVESVGAQGGILTEKNTKNSRWAQLKVTAHSIQ